MATHRGIFRQLSQRRARPRGDKYIFVFQDIRGQYESEGVFVMQRPARAGDTTALDEGTDTYDTIEWLLKNVQRTTAGSGCWVSPTSAGPTIMALLEPHPGAQGISPQASPADMWLGDDFHHNGAFRLSYGFEYADELESGKDLKHFAFDRYDTYDWYLGSARWRMSTRILPRQDPDLERLRGTTQLRRVLAEAGRRRCSSIRPTVPTLNVAGWWDQEDFYGPLTIYEALREARRGPATFSSSAPGTTGAGPTARTAAGRDRLRQSDVPSFRERSGAVLRLLPQGQADPRLARGPHVRERHEQLAALSTVGRRRPT